MKEVVNVAQIECAEMRAEVFFNGWLAYRVRDAEGRVYQQRLDPWLLEGENRFEVRLGPLVETDEGAASLPARARFELSYYKTTDGEVLPPTGRLAFYRWSPFEGPLYAKGLTHVFSHSFSTVKAYGWWAWEDATPYMPTDRPAIEGLVIGLQRALVARDTDAVIDIFRLKLDEMSRIHDPMSVNLFDTQRVYLEDRFRHPDFRMVKLDASKLLLESSAGGRLVTVTDQDGDPPLLGRAGEDIIGFRLVLSKIKDHWFIVR